MKIRFTSKIQSLVLVLAAILMADSTVEGKELIKNQSFKGSDMSPWRLSQEGGLPDDAFQVSEGELEVRIPKPYPSSYVRLMQPVKIKEGKTYTLTFEAKADAEGLSEKKHQLVIGQRENPWNPYGLRVHIVFEPEWKKYEHTFTATEIDKKNEPVLRLSFGALEGTAFFRGFSLTEESSGSRLTGGLRPEKKGPPPPRKW